MFLSISFGAKGDVSGCSFVNCSASANGGAIFIVSGSVSGCSFVNCSAYWGGAIFIAVSVS